MAKYEYNTEYEIKSSPKFIYPYLSTAQGLSEWFADEVIVKSPKIFDIYWDGEGHIAELVSSKLNTHVKYVFATGEGEDPLDPNRLEMRLSYNDFTDSTFLSITDYSEMNDEELLRDLWDGLIEKLTELIGA
jgi:uncharacterized protein YndB with AHSA1/START domain